MHTALGLLVYTATQEDVHVYIPPATYEHWLFPQTLTDCGHTLKCMPIRQVLEIWSCLPRPCLPLGCSFIRRIFKEVCAVRGPHFHLLVKLDIEGSELEQLAHPRGSEDVAGQQESPA